jgi:hypothetical protein
MPTAPTAAAPDRRKPGVARPSLLVGVLAVLGAGWNWVLNSAAPELLNKASQLDAATGSAIGAAQGASSAVAMAGPAVSQAIQGACLGAISVVLSSVLLRAKTGKARAAAAVAMTVGAVAAEPLVFAAQWLPTGLLETFTSKVDLAIKSSALEYVNASTGQIESAALAAGVLFPGVILAIKGLFWVTKRDTRREVWQLAFLGIPLLAAVRIGQAVVAPLPGGTIQLNLDSVRWATTGTAAGVTAVAAWYALVISQPVAQPGDEPAEPASDDA